MEKINNEINEQHVHIYDISVKEKQENTFNNNIEYKNVENMPNSGTGHNNRLSLELKSEESIDKDLKMADHKFHVPENLKKTFICSLILFIIGATLIGIGFIQDVAEADPGKGITFWTLGGIVMIPGGYYSYQFYKAKKAKDEKEREDILSEIPEL